MKALTLTQPYATLAAEYWKAWETRSWRTSYRGPLAIHAASGYGGVGGRFAHDRICLGLPEQVRRLIDHHYGVGPARVWMLPTGCVIAVTWLLDCVPTQDVEPDEVERAVGDYTPGRWAWIFRRPVTLSSPVEVKGRQGLWNLDDDLIPANVMRAISHAV